MTKKINLDQFKYISKSKDNLKKSLNLPFTKSHMADLILKQGVGISVIKDIYYVILKQMISLV